jgi:hypothetical protein
MSTGVMYVATGQSFYEDAIRSAQSFKKRHPALKVCMFSDVGERPAICDDYFLIEDPHVRSKVDCMGRSPYERTLYLDTDTRVIGMLDDAFRLLDRFDIMLCHGDNKNQSRAYPRPDIPDALPVFQSAVMFFRKSRRTDEAFAFWKTLYAEAGYKLDQPTLREVIWRRDFSLLVLPREYNIGRIATVLTNKNNEADLKIMHADRFKSGGKSPFRKSLHFVNTTNISLRNIATAIRLTFGELN